LVICPSVAAVMAGRERLALSVYGLNVI
jgi:hypothetical protein